MVMIADSGSIQRILEKVPDMIAHCGSSNIGPESQPIGHAMELPPTKKSEWSLLESGFGIEDVP